MEMCKMAELRYEAPLATFDLDEWNEFLDGDGEGDHPDGPLDAAARQPPGPPAGGSMAEDGGGVMMMMLRRGAGGEEEEEAFSGSLEDLVSTFDDKIIKCFRNFAEQAEIIAPVQVRTQEDLNQDSQTWWTLTGNYGGILPIDWSQLYPQSQTDTQNNNETYKDAKSYGSECQSEKEEDDDEDDDDETDMDQDENERTIGENTFVAPQKEEEEEEPVVTADEVISEIEGMLDGLSSDTNGTNAKNGLISQRKKLEHVIKKFADKELQTLTLSDLYVVRDELNVSVGDLSEILVDELAVRDDLDYEKELKNQFIWLLLNVQKRRREVLLEMTYRQKSKVIGNGYLTTVIPYQASQDPLAIEKLLIYIKILSAINEDHCSVPGLLTDYILRVLCPTT